MPAIRDYSFAYESTTTDGGLTIPICSYEQGDLLIAILVGDTGTPTVGVSSSTGWFQIFQRINTASLTVLAKYAPASGEPDVVMTASVNETYSGVLVSVRDVRQDYSSGNLPLNSNNTATGTKIALPTVTTPEDNCLCLAIVSSSGTSSISFLESALQSLIMVDGAAEGLGVGWFFKKTAGLTTAYNAISLASAAGGMGVIALRPPASGAQVIPTYPAADASILLSPNPGVAWDSNTAMAATADTNFGTSIAGRTCNDATVANVADIGIDAGAFMSFSGLTNVASATAMSGAEAIMAAARYNVGNRNILCHFRHPTPVQNQRLSPMTSGRGVWFGMRSGATAATNLKVWQVHGADAPLIPGYVQPVIINAANTDHNHTAGTLSNSDVRSYGFWHGGLGALTQQAAFGPLWAMDTTTIAGGVAAEPVDIAGTVRAAALNKVRFSSILQGANQMLCLQALQFGDGGTNPIYLEFDSTAIEFPSQRNAAKKLINYNGTDNLIGFTYYAGASDTIIHRASVVSSASLYHWRIHASSSALATYDFNGLSLIGAGDVQLRPVVTFTGMAFTECRTITLNSALVDDCTLTDSTFDTSLAEFENVTNCEFTRSAGRYTPGARLSGVGAIDLTGHEYTNFDSENWTVPSTLKMFVPFWDSGRDFYRTAHTAAGTTYLAKVGASSMILDPSAPYGVALRSPASSADSYVTYLLPQTLGTADFCVELRAKIPVVSAESCMLFRITSSLAVGGISLRTNGGQTQFISNISGLPTPVAASIPINTWFHVAVTRSGSTIRLFLNGTQIASGTTGLNDTSSNWLLFGTTTSFAVIGETQYSDVMVTIGAAKYTSNFTPAARLGSRTPLVIEDTTGTVDLTVINGATPSYTTYGATVNVIAGAVTTSLLVTDTAGTPIQNAQVMVAASAGPLPYNATVTIVNSGTTATVTHTAHGMSTGDKVRIKGASHYQNNGVFTITVTGANTYTYTLSSAPGSNPTGTINCTYVALYGTTDVNGLISMTRVFAANQPVSGWARKSSAEPYFKTGLVSGTINSTTGASLAALLIADV